MPSRRARAGRRDRHRRRSSRASACEVTGKAIAIGGGVYASAMAEIGGEVRSFQDFTYEVAPVSAGTSCATSRCSIGPPAAVTWPGLFGVRARLLAHGRRRIAVRAVDRGPWHSAPRRTARDISVAARADRSGSRCRIVARPPNDAPCRRAAIDVHERGVDLVGSSQQPRHADLGDDNRNYFRATRADVSLSRAWEWSASTLTPYVGARWERAESVRPDSFATGGPWSFEGRRDRQDMLRPNPPIDSGTIISGLIGARLEHDANGITTRARVRRRDRRVQSTLRRIALVRPAHVRRSDHVSDVRDAVTPFRRTLGCNGVRHVRQRSRVVIGPGQAIIVPGPGTDDAAPALGVRRRIGEHSHDQHAVARRRRADLPRRPVQHPDRPHPAAARGPPVVTLRKVLGGADSARWPSLAQADGVRVSVSAAYAEYLIDPARRHSFFGVGLSLAR